MAENKRGAETGNSGGVVEEFGPEQAKFEMMNRTMNKIDEAIEFAFECGHKAAELGLSLEQGKKIFKSNLG